MCLHFSQRRQSELNQQLDRELEKREGRNWRERERGRIGKHTDIEERESKKGITVKRKHGEQGTRK